MSNYSQKEIIVIAKSLVEQGGYQGNPLMDKPEIRTAVESILNQPIRTGGGGMQLIGRRGQAIYSTPTPGGNPI